MTAQSEFVEVSVIMPSFRSEKTIARAIASVARQTVKPREIIVVDDGSDDNSFEIVSSFKNQLNGIDLRIFQQENRGAGAARNIALNEAQFDLVAFLDADDEWLPSKIEMSIEQISENKLDLISHNVWIVNGQNESVLDIASRFRAASKYLFHGLFRRGFISTSTVVARRAPILSVGGFDENLRSGQDFDLWLKLLDRPGVRFGAFDKPLTRYHVEPNSISSQISQRLKYTLEIACRHAPALRSHPGSAIISIWFRIIVIHMEAALANFNKRKLFSSLRAMIFIPYRLITVTFRYILETQFPRSRK